MEFVGVAFLIAAALSAPASRTNVKLKLKFVDGGGDFVIEQARAFLEKGTLKPVIRNIRSILWKRMKMRDTKKLTKVLVNLLQENIDDVTFIKKLKFVYDQLPKYNTPCIRADRRADDLSMFISDPGVILDIGCADGSILRSLKTKYNLSKEQVIGVDIIDTNPKDITFTKVINNKIFLPDSSVDTVIVLMTAHHFDDAMINEIKRVMRSGATLIVREHDYTNQSDAVFWDIMHLMYECVIYKEKTPEEFLNQYRSIYRSKDAWIKIFEGHGLTKKMTTDYNPYDPFKSIYMVFENVA